MPRPATWLLAAVLAVIGMLANADSPTSGDSYSESWGLAIGTELPSLDAQDHSGTRVSLGDLVGRRGLLLVLVRSADW